MFHVRKEPHAAPGERSDRYSVPIHNSIAGQGRQSRSGCQDADEVEWICARQRDPLIGGRLSTRFPEKTDRLGQGILLAGESGHKSATANFSASLESTIHP